MPTPTDTKVSCASQQAAPAPLTEAAVRAALAGCEPEAIELAVELVEIDPTVCAVWVEDGCPVLDCGDCRVRYEYAAGTDDALILALNSERPAA